MFRKHAMLQGIAAALLMQGTEAVQSSGGTASAPAEKPAEKVEKPIPEGHERTKFHFKETKVDGKKTGVRRPTVELDIPVPDQAEILAAFSAPMPSEEVMKLKDEEKAKDPAYQALKIREYVMDVIKDGAIFPAAREQVNANDKITQDGLDENKLSLLYLAFVPKAERRGAGISKETWEEFKADYISVMAKETGKPLEKIELAADLFVNRLQKVKTLKPVVKALRNELAIWYQHTAEKEDFAEVYEFLDGKAETFINADESALLKELGAI